MNIPASETGPASVSSSSTSISTASTLSVPSPSPSAPAPGTRSVSSASTPQASRPRLAGLDHLRALAIILVFLYHYRLFGNPPLIDTIGEFGWTGVDLFFVLSGYLIGGQLLGAIAKGSPLSYKEFYLKRAYRILPAYLLILLIYFTIPAFIERSSLPPLWKFLTFTQNFGLDPKTHAAFSHAWSLCIEEQFYLVLPVFILVLTKFASSYPVSGASPITGAPTVSTSQLPISGAPSSLTQSSRLPGFLFTSLAIVFLAGFAIRYAAWHYLVAPAPDDHRGLEFYRWIYYPTYSRLDGLLAGLTLAGLFHLKPLLWHKLTSRGNSWIALGLVLIVSACYYCGTGLKQNAIIGFAAVAIAYGILVLAALSPASILYRYSSRFTGFIAAISYSLYLVHKQMIHLTHVWFSSGETDKDSYWLFSLCAVFSLAAAILLHYAVERPFLRLRDRMLRKPR